VKPCSRRNATTADSQRRLLLGFDLVDRPGRLGLGQLLGRLDVAVDDLADVGQARLAVGDAAFPEKGVELLRLAVGDPRIAAFRRGLDGLLSGCGGLVELRLGGGGPGALDLGAGDRRLRLVLGLQLQVFDGERDTREDVGGDLAGDLAGRLGVEHRLRVGFVLLVVGVPGLACPVDGPGGPLHVLGARRRPQTTTSRSVLDSVHTSWPWDMTRATIVRAYIAGVPLMM
jgi:hypothetical protein